MRELVGYHRHDILAGGPVLNQIWELDRVFTNSLLPQQKLVFKQRNGAKVKKRYDVATTPHQRAIGWEGLSIIRMDAEFKKVHPAAQSRQVLELSGQIKDLALAKKPATLKQVVNLTQPVSSAEIFNWDNKSPFPEVLT